MFKLLKHFKTVGEHRRMVRAGCFRVGLYYQGLVPDIILNIFLNGKSEKAL